MFQKRKRRQPKPGCQWEGHGIHHHGPAAIEVSLGRPCGHDTQGPFRTCLKQGLILLEDGGRDHAQTPCPICKQMSYLRIIDPDSHPVHDTTQQESSDG